MPQTLTFFMLLNSQPSWLALSRSERLGYIDETISPILARYPQVSLRFYDAEAFSGRCTDIAVFETADYGTLDQLGNETNAPNVCDNAAQSLQQASAIIASWSTPLKNAWNAAEGHFETAITACKASDGQAMVRAYGRAESALEGLRKLLGNLDCQLDPDNPGGEICK